MQGGVRKKTWGKGTKGGRKEIPLERTRKDAIKTHPSWNQGAEKKGDGIRRGGGGKESKRIESLKLGRGGIQNDESSFSGMWHVNNGSQRKGEEK